MPSLPTGTVTFLFTDIEGSTLLLQQLGDAYADVLVECRRLVCTAVVERGGQKVDTEGDASFTAFPSAREALIAAVSAQQRILRYAWPDSAAVRVRMGLHTGEARVAEGGYVGMDVHRAARMCAAAHGSQILVSDVTHGLVARDLPNGISLRDLGEHRLKDLAHPHRLFQVLAPGLPINFPTLRSLDAHAHNLPIQLTSFIGRSREIAEVKRLLGAARLVTLTGAGGAGKTRLALQAAADVVEDYPDGVWLAEFASIADRARIPKTVASALNVSEQPGRDLNETLVDALRPKPLLLILDNCEHLLAACSDLAAELLRKCPQVRILATSREGLGVPGETLWRVPSLSVPESIHRLPPSEELVLYEAVRLFVDRAAATTPGFTVTSENAPAVAQVCRRLDGIPLAIELAAARIKVLAVEQIAARLDDRFRLLTGGSRTALPRQQTLRGAMNWSYDLLSETERVLLRRLSVFAGGWTLEAAESVCAGESVEATEILDLLTSLVDKSLVLAETQHREVRYRLLETVRQYSRDRLEESGEARQARSRHLDWHLRSAEEAAPLLHGPDEGIWLERLETEHDNLRSALERSRRETDAERGLRLAVALRRFWEMRGHFTEGRRWLEDLVARGNTASPLLRAAALNGAGVLAYRQGDYGRVAALCAEALALCEAHKDVSEAALSLHFLAHLKQVEGDYGAASEMMQQSVALYREAGDRVGAANSVDCLGEVARSAQDYDRAAVLTEEAMALYSELGYARGRAHAMHNLGYVRLRQGDAAGARALFRESLQLARGLENNRDVVYALAGLAGASVAGAEPRHAARLFGAVEALLASVEIQLEPAEHAEFVRNTAAVRARLEADVFAAAWAEGRAMTLEQAIEHALADRPDVTTP
jgi:predicted ATPase/class 3 adenylate cyclase